MSESPICCFILSHITYLSLLLAANWLSVIKNIKPKFEKKIYYYDSGLGESKVERREQMYIKDPGHRQT